MTQIKSKLIAVQMTWMNTITSDTDFSCGSVMRKKRVNMPAPSIAAASDRSPGIDCIAARKEIV